jgi:hypothetical protein
MNKFEQTGSVLNIDPPGRPVSVTERLQRCIDADGHQFEHLN